MLFDIRVKNGSGSLEEKPKISTLVLSAIVQYISYSEKETQAHGKPNK
jgi:hypothetical protein